MKILFHKKIVLSLFFFLIFLNECNTKSKSLCVVKTENSNLYQLVFDRPLKKYGKIFSGINLITDIEEKFEGKDYVRINNNYWNGTIPTRNDTKVSLWVEKDACNHVEFGSLPESRVLNLTFKLDGNPEEGIDNERTSKLKIYLLEDKRFLILPPSPKWNDLNSFISDKETDSILEKFQKARYVYGRFEDLNGLELKFTVESANRFEGGETFEYGFSLIT
jgi:hypothetical protein